MSATSILPINGVPDELIRVLNDRFREVSAAGSSPAAAGLVPGIFFGTKTRPDANGTTVGTFGSDTDTGIVYQVRTVSSRQLWRYAAGVLRASFANAPTPGVDDAGLLWLVSDYGHILRWTGTLWEWTDTEGGYIQGFTVAPTGAGWQLCNGSATHRLTITAGVVSETAFTTPNLTGTPSYLKFAAAYTGTLVAAVAPNITATVPQGTGAGTAVNAIGTAGEPRRFELLPYFRR